jgi:hypothetical protein
MEMVAMWFGLGWASTALSAADGRGHHYSTLIWPHESNLRVVGFSPIPKTQCSPEI